MPKLSLSKAWEETVRVLSRDGRLFLAVALALVVLPQTVVGLIAPMSGSEPSALSYILLAVLLVLGIIAQLALIRLAIGPSTTVGSAIGRAILRTPVWIGAAALFVACLFIILIPLVLVLSALGVTVASGPAHEASASVVALILLVAILSYGVFQLAAPVAVAEDGGSIHLITRSWHLSRGAYWRLLAFVLLVFFGLILVALAGQFGLGSLIQMAFGPPDALSLSALVISLIVSIVQAVFTVIFAVMLARIYVQIAASGEGQASVPKSGT